MTTQQAEGVVDSGAERPRTGEPKGERKPAPAITVAESTAVVRCPPGATVLDAFERQGGRFGVVPVGCRGGGCGVCKVRVLSGSYRSKAMSRAHVSEAEQEAGYVLACCIYPETDLHLESVPVPKTQSKNP